MTDAERVHWDPEDLRLVTHALTRQRLCVPCIVSATGVTRTRVDAIVNEISKTVVIKTKTVGACDACGIERTVFGRS